MLGPGIGGFELVVIAIVALVVVGPKDLPLLMRKVGRFMAKARQMAGEFRASFDEMARQSELDELRREVEALRSGKMLDPLGPEGHDTLSSIRQELSPQPFIASPGPDVPSPDAHEDTPPPPAPEPEAASEPDAPKPRASARRPRPPRPKTTPAARRQPEPKP